MYVPASFRKWWDMIAGERGAPDPSLATMQALGSAIIATTIPISVISPGIGQALVANTLRLQPIFLTKRATIIGVKWYQVTQGNYTSSNYNGVGLYSYSNGTLTLVASSTDDGNIWKAAATALASKTFTTPYNAAPGVYFIGALYNQSAQVTAPALSQQNTGASSAGLYNLDFTNSAALNSTLAGQNTLPSPQAASGLTTSTSAPLWFALY
jgi:hypothetical protein